MKRQRVSFGSRVPAEGEKEALAKAPEVMGETKKMTPGNVWKILPIKHKILTVVAAVVTVIVIVPIAVFAIYGAFTGSFPSIPLLTPARDLTGTWRNPISGQGFVLWGTGYVSEVAVQFEPAYFDVEWKAKQSGNTIAGDTTMTWVKGGGAVATVETPHGVEKVVVSSQAIFSYVPRSSTSYATGRVEGTKITIDFGGIPMTGSFTTDMITCSGVLTPAEGVQLNCKLSLSRVW